MEQAVASKEKAIKSLETQVKNKIWIEEFSSNFRKFM